MKFSKLFVVLAASALLAGCGGSEESSDNPSSGTTSTTVSDTGTTSEGGTSEGGTSEGGTSVVSSEDPSSETPSSSTGGGTTSTSVNPTIPSVTTPKDMTTIHPNHTFTFSSSKNAEGNYDSDTYIQNIVDVDPNKYADICQIEVVISIDFGGKNNAEQYYGGEFGVGADGVTRDVTQWGDSSGFWEYQDADATPDGAYAKGVSHQFFDVSNIVDTDQIYLVFLYAAKNTFVAKITEINFIHSEGYSLKSQEISVNKTLVSNTQTAGTVNVPLSGLTSTNPFSYFDLNLSYTASESYTGGVVWIEGVYAEGLVLPNAPRNNVNIGKKMAPEAGTKTVEFVRVYLDNYCAVDPTGYIALVCNWAPASEIVVNSVTFYQLDGQAVGPTPVELDDSFLSETQSPLEEKLGMDNIKTAMANSLVNEGNNHLLKNAVAKMQSGAETSIAYIGGSITEGDNMPTDKITDLPGQAYSKSWAYWSYKFLAGKYGTGSNVKYHNAGMSGTASDLGVARFKKDVLDFNPCLIFIEFAVNNGELAIHKESYESMIRMALNDANKPAVVLAMSWTSYSGGAVENYMTQLGVKYGLPVISIHKGLNAYKGQIFQFDNTSACWCSNDNLHPSVNGHMLYAKLICYGVSTIAKKSQDSAASMPEVTYSDRYQNMKLYQRGDSKVTVSGFDTSSATYVAPTLKSDQVSGQGGWKLASGTGTLAMNNVSAKAVFVLYCANQYDGSNGTIKVSVSGGYTASMDRVLPYDNQNQLGWGNVCIIPVLVEDAAKTCSISLSLSGVGQVIGIAVAD